MKVIGVIPARGGSKGVYLKNIKKLRGKPLIYYTIDSAISSGVFDEIVVSTDHAEIKKVCNQYEKIKIIDRPKKISQDHSPTELTLIHACEFLFKKLYLPILNFLIVKPAFSTNCPNRPKSNASFLRSAIQSGC